MRITFRFLACAAAGLLFTAVGTASHAVSTTYHQVAKYSLDGANGWDYIAFDSSTRHLYITRGTYVAVMDAGTGRPVGTIPGTNGVHGVALASDLDKGFTSNGRSNTVTMFNTKTLQVLKQIKVGNGPDAIIYDPSTDRVFTFNGRGSDSTVIDAGSGHVLGTIKLPGRPEFAVADGQGHVYVNLEDKSALVAIDSKAMTAGDAWPLAPGEGPSGLAMDVKNRRLFSVCDNGKMVVVDADSGKVLATPVIGNGPDAAGFDPDLGYAFSSNGEDGTLSIIHEDSPTQFTTVDAIPTQPGARTMAVDPKTHEVYVVTAKANPPAPGESRYRRTYEPDTFVVLVYAP